MKEKVRQAILKGNSISILGDIVASELSVTKEEAVKMWLDTVQEVGLNVTGYILM